MSGRVKHAAAISIAHWLEYKNSLICHSGLFLSLFLPGKIQEFFPLHICCIFQWAVASLAPKPRIHITKTPINKNGKASAGISQILGTNSRAILDSSCDCYITAEVYSWGCRKKNSCCPEESKKNLSRVSVYIHTNLVVESVWNLDKWDSNLGERYFHLWWNMGKQGLCFWKPCGCSHGNGRSSLQSMLLRLSNPRTYVMWR